MLNIPLAVILSAAKNPVAHKVRAFFNLAGLFATLRVTEEVGGV